LALERAAAEAFLRNARRRFCAPFRIRVTAEGVTPNGSLVASNEVQFEVEACLHEDLRSCTAT
jgi:hypothetical protein